MIELREITKKYKLGENDLEVLRDINLKVETGEYLSIVGTSGSGKSTLMNIIGLLDLPTSGKVLIDGKNAAELDDNRLSDLRNQHIGFVFQQFNLLEKLTVLQNVLMPVQYARVKLAFNPEERAEMLLKRFGIWERKDFYPNKISGGQQQRVAITRGLIMNPKLLLADEPTGNLDTKTGDEILDLIEELNRDLAVTVMVVTHEPDVAARTKRQIHLLDGRIVKDTRGND